MSTKSNVPAPIVPNLTEIVNMNLTKKDVMEMLEVEAEEAIEEVIASKGEIVDKLKKELEEVQKKKDKLHETEKTKAESKYSDYHYYSSF